MNTIFLILTLVYTIFCDPRSPRVYNVLITSKKNLAPSQALPVYEPVLRTTSVGLAFPPFFYTHLAPIEDPRYVSNVPIQPFIKEVNPQVVQNQHELQQEGYIPEKSTTPDVVSSPEQGEQQGVGELVQPQNPNYPPSEPNTRNLPSNVVPLDQFVPVYPPHLTYQQFFPKEDSKSQPLNLQKVYEEPKSEDPKQVVANFKRNPEIPDVPPPPLPVRNTREV